MKMDNVLGRIGYLRSYRLQPGSNYDLATKGSLALDSHYGYGEESRGLAVGV